MNSLRRIGAQMYKTPDYYYYYYYYHKMSSACLITAVLLQTVEMHKGLDDSN